MLFVLAAYQSDVSAYHHASLTRRLPGALLVSQEAACRSVAPGRRHVASMSVLVAAPTTKAPRGASRNFTRRVFAAVVGVIGVVTLILTAAERWPVYDSIVKGPVGSARAGLLCPLGAHLAALGKLGTPRVRPSH